MIHEISYKKGDSMKLILSVILFLCMACSPQINQYKNTQKSNFVDPFMCASGEYGYTDLAAMVPFGMVKLAPDSDPIGHSGYDFSAEKVLGFSGERSVMN